MPCARPVVKGEVDWVDVLAYCILLAKEPDVVAELRRRPEEAVVDPIALRIIGSRMHDRERNHAERLADFRVRIDTPAARLFCFMFPHLSADNAGRDNASVDAIRYRRPLLTLLRLGLPPGGI